MRDFLTRLCLPEWTYITEYKNAKQTFVNLKKHEKLRKYGFDHSEHSSVNPYRQTKTMVSKCQLSVFD